MALPQQDLDRLQVTLQTQTEAAIAAEVERMNAVAARDADAPLADALQEVFLEPDERWEPSKVRSVVLALRKDYQAIMRTYTARGDPLPSDDEVRAQLVRMSRAYATLARENQHRRWFNFFTDRGLQKDHYDAALEMILLREKTDAGTLTEQAAMRQLMQSRAGAAAQSQALSRLDELRAAGATPSKRQIRAARANVAAAAATTAVAQPRRRPRVPQSAAGIIPAARLAAVRQAVVAQATPPPSQ